MRFRLEKLINDANENKTTRKSSSNIHSNELPLRFMNEESGKKLLEIEKSRKLNQSISKRSISQTKKTTIKKENTPNKLIKKNPSKNNLVKT